MLVEQGNRFTVVGSRHFLELSEAERKDPSAAFISARRVWLPAAPGTDWLHEGAAEQVGPTGLHHAVESRREDVQIGAGGGVIEVAVLLYLMAENTELGRRIQGDLYEWVKRRAAERRKETGFENADPAPDFAAVPARQLAEGMRGELADVAKVPERRLELLSAERRQTSVLYAVYRDAKTGRQYAVEVGQDEATFSRLDPINL